MFCCPVPEGRDGIYLAYFIIIAKETTWHHYEMNYQVILLSMYYHDEFIITKEKRDCKRSERKRSCPLIIRTFFSLPYRDRCDKVASVTK
ncbi:MAG: hypothetical protein D3910_23040 [Candidatus Electrothrix sp. ATG2]|nr:hypothetical protein [Candidatus Electrothrix sp. ATG2]